MTGDRRRHDELDVRLTWPEVLPSDTGSTRRRARPVVARRAPGRERDTSVPTGHDEDVDERDEVAALRREVALLRADIARLTALVEERISDEP